MKKIEEKELSQIEGGGFNWAICAGIVAGITIIIGVIDGFVNPQKCNN